jgi:hypothetical protein
VGPSQPHWAYWLTDNFTNPDVDAMWDTSKSGPGIAMAERDDRLEMWVPSDPAPDPTKGVGEIYSANCEVLGDFDVTVYYSLITWPAGDNLTLGLSAGVSRTGRRFTIERAGGQPDSLGNEVYRSNLQAGSQVRTGDSHGRLRLRRRSGVLRAYYRYRGKWIVLGSVTVKGPATLGLSFSSDSPPWGGQPALAALDDFRAIVDGVRCPAGVPPPPRKRGA